MLKRAKKIVYLVVFMLSSGLAGFTRMHHYARFQYTVQYSPCSDYLDASGNQSTFEVV